MTEVLYLYTPCSLRILKRTFLWLVSAYAALFCADFQGAFFHFDNISFDPAFHGIVHPYFGAKGVASGVGHIDVSRSVKAALSDLD